MINKKQLEKLLKKFVEKGTGFCISEIIEQNDNGYCVELINNTYNGINMYHGFTLEKEDLVDVSTCLEAVAREVYGIWENWDANEEFQYGYEDSYYKKNPIELATILDDYDDKLKEETDLVYNKIYAYLDKLQEAQEQESEDEQR